MIIKMTDVETHIKPKNVDGSHFYTKGLKRWKTF